MSLVGQLAATDVAAAVSHAARTSYGRIVAYLAYKFGDIAAAEDALAEAFSAALTTWPRTGVPDSPDAWLMTAAKRNVLQALRHAKVEHDPAVTVLWIDQNTHAPDPPTFPDERLKLLFACAHPAIEPSIHTALMLQTVLGVEADKIASAFLVSPAAMAQRLVRAKSKIRLAGIRFKEPEPHDMPERLQTVLEAIYAAFGLAWDDHVNGALAQEAMYLADLVATSLPQRAEPPGLLALMLFCDARKVARYTRIGSGLTQFVPLHSQDMSLWDKPQIDLANRILWRASGLRQPGPFQLEAAIQSAHCQRLYTGVVPWQSITYLYAQLLQLSPTLGAMVGHAVALGESDSATTALAALDAIAAKHDITRYAPYWAARAHWQARNNDAAAVQSYQAALRLHTGQFERAYLQGQINALKSNF